MPWVYNKGTNYEPEPYLVPDAGGEKALYFGFELEMALPCRLYNGSREVENALNNTRQYFIRGGDSSIVCPVDYMDVELKSHPSTWNYLIQNRTKLNNAVRSLRHLGALSGNEHSCGMHVHFSRVLQKEHLLSVMQLIYSNNDAIRQFSQRQARAIELWAKMYTLKSNRLRPMLPRCTCLMCMDAYRKRLEEYERIMALPDVEREREELSAQFNRNLYHNKYSAVHVCQRTIEIRVFTGTVDCIQMWANLEFCRAAIEYTAQPGYDWKTQSTWSAFATWVRTQRKFACLKRALNKVSVPSDQVGVPVQEV